MNGTDLRRVVARNIRRIRKERGWNQAYLAKRAGICTGYLSDIETTKRWPSADKLSRLAAALRVSPFQLMLPNDDSPYFDRHRVLSSYNRRLAEALEQTRREVFNNMVSGFNNIDISYP